MGEQNVERRFFGTDRLELRVDGEKRILVGFIPYNREAIIGDNWFREIIRPGFFAPAIEAGQQVVARYAHESSLLPLGNSAAMPPTLRFFDGPEGLTYEADLPDTTQGRDFAVSVERGDIQQTSFAFRTRGYGSDDERWTEEEGKIPLRELIRVDQFVDVAPVVFGAYGGATMVSMRTAEIRDQQQEARQQELADPDVEDAEPGLDFYRHQLEIDESRAAELATTDRRS